MRAWQVTLMREGLVAGLLGYAAVALVFAGADLGAGHSPFRTAWVLGQAIFGGEARGTGVEAGPVLAFNGLHMMVMLATGVVAAWLVREVELHRSLWYVVFFVLLMGVVYVIVVVGAIAVEAARLVPWWGVIVANVLAALAIATYLRWRHPRLTGAAREEVERG